MAQELLPDVKVELYNPSEKDRKIVRDIYSRRERMSAKRQDEENRWDRWDDLYVSYTDETEDYRSTINPPVTFSVIETAKTEMIDQRVKYQLRAKNIDFEQNQEILENITEHVWDKSQGDFEYYKLIHDLLVYGTSIGKVKYHKDFRTVRDIVDYKIDPKTGKETKKYKEKLIVDYDDVKFEHINIRNFFVDEAATGFEDARDCIERHIYDIHEFRRIYQHWPNVDKVTPGGDTFEPELPRVKAGGRMGMVAGETASTAGQEDKRNEAENLVEVLEYWNKPMDRHVVVANGVLIFDEPIPYDHKELPYFRCLDVIVPDEFYGIGECEVIQHYHEEMKLLRRMMLDNHHLSMHQMFVTDQHFDEAELYPEPGKILHIERGGQFVPINMPSLGGDTFNQIEMLRKDVEDATGINRQLLGAQASTQATLGEIQLLKESALKRIRQKLRGLEALGMKRLGRLVVATIQQYYRRPVFQIDSKTGKKIEQQRTVQIEGKSKMPEWQEITPELVRGDFEVIVVPGSSLPLSRGLRMRTLTELYPLMEPLTRPTPDGEEPLFSLQAIWEMMLKEANLPPQLMTKVVGSEEVTAEDVLGAATQGRRTEGEARQQLADRAQVEQLRQQFAPQQLDENGEVVEGEGPQLPPELEQGIMREQGPQEVAADEITALDIAAAEDHTHRILEQMEVELDESVVTPRHIRIHEDELTSPEGAFVDADPETRAAFKQHIEDEKEMLREKLNDIEL